LDSSLRFRLEQILRRVSQFLKFSGGVAMGASQTSTMEQEVRGDVKDRLNTLFSFFLKKLIIIDLSSKALRCCKKCCRIHQWRFPS